jgi:hypothetical protein
MARKKADSTVILGGREVTLLKAALIAQEADRLDLVPGQVRRVTVPRPAPTHVVITGYRLTIATGAAIAAEADARGVRPKKLIEAIVMEHANALTRRARRRGTKKVLQGTFSVRSDSTRGGETRDDS